MLGLKRNNVNLVTHDESWSILFEETKVDLFKVLGELISDVQHVGSTAVKGIKSKPIIDIAVSVNNFDSMGQIILLLERNGYEYRGDGKNKGGHLFVKCSETDIRTHHIHIVEQHDPQWENFLRFRDLLNQDPKLAARYEKLKERLAKKYSNDRKEYTKCKDGFIVRILRKYIKTS